MRKYLILKQSIDNIIKLMVYDTGDGCYLFLYDSVNDKPSIADYWFDSMLDAESTCKEDYNINENDWILINDPLENCQDDIIEPVRIKGRNLNKPEFGRFEKLINNQWVEIFFEKTKL